MRSSACKSVFCQRKYLLSARRKIHQTLSSSMSAESLPSFQSPLSNAQASPPLTVNLRLITQQESYSRTLHDRVSLKIGRQVKSAAEKASAQKAKVPASANDNENGDTVRERVGADGAAASSSLPSDSAIDAAASSLEKTVLANVPASAGNSNNTTSVEPVWFKSKVVSRSHAEIWVKDGQVYLRDVGSSSGTFLNDLRLSPPSKMSRPYPLREGDVIQLGVDYQGRTEDIYKAVEIKISLDVDDEQVKLQQQIPIRFKAALFLLLIASNPYSTQGKKDPQNESKPEDTSVDCCICISGIGPFQALFIAPCSHCFHYKCIQNVLKESIMFPCPVCRQVANLEASVSMESVAEPAFNALASLRRSISSLGLGGGPDDSMQVDQTFSIEGGSAVGHNTMVHPRFSLEFANSHSHSSHVASTHATQQQRQNQLLLQQHQQDHQEIPAFPQQAFEQQEEGEISPGTEGRSSIDIPSVVKMEDI